MEKTRFSQKQTEKMDLEQNVLKDYNIAFISSCDLHTPQTKI